MGGLEKISALIQRFTIIEDQKSLLGAHANLEDKIVDLYSAILTYKARALRHLEHSSGRRFISNTFKPDQWNGLLQPVQEVEQELITILGYESYVVIEGISNHITVIQKELRALFEQQLNAIEVSV
jgi:hypothetical protein